MHVYVIINMLEHMALLTKRSRSSSQQLTDTTNANTFVPSLLHAYPYIRLPFAIILHTYM